MRNILEIRDTALADLKPPPNVLRYHSDRKMKALTKHVEENGVMAPLMTTSDGTIIDGRARYLAAERAGLTDVRTICVSHLPESRIRALRLSLNRFQEEASWDRPGVAEELRHLLEINFDLELTGFSTVEIESYLEIEGSPPGEEETVDASSLSAPPVSKPGDIWSLPGNSAHRLACGNSHDPTLADRLFDGRQAQACFSDPPYNVRISGFVSGTGRHKEFAQGSGEMSDSEFVEFLLRAQQATISRLSPDAVAFWCIDWRHLWHMVEASRRSGLELLNMAVWVKSNGGMGSLYRSQHELICVFKRPGAQHRNNIELGRHGRTRTNVWEYRGVNVMGPERHLLSLHPTVKPAALVADAIRDVTLPGDIVFDPFLGSGTTLIAAERTKRVCYGIDIEPKYVDLAIRRWQAETGRDAVRLADGVAFNEAEERPNHAPVALLEYRK